MRRTILISILCIHCSTTWAQIVLSNGGVLNIKGGSTAATQAMVVLTNSPATPINMINSVSAQGIMMETEYSKLSYVLDQGTTAINVPYLSNTTGSWVRFPLNMGSITAGVHATGKTGTIRFSSTKSGTLSTGWDNTGYMPSQVSNVCSTPCTGTNNSANVIDRFWVIEPVYYTTQPAVTLDFTYIMSETDVNGGNTPSMASNLIPQRFDSTAAGSVSPNWGWNGFPSNAAEMGTNSPAGSITATSIGTLTGVQVTSSNFFPDWTLVSSTMLLPIELLDYTGSCNLDHVRLDWSTVSERNSAYFGIEKSKDGFFFEEIAKIPAAGSSTVKRNYSLVDNSTGNENIVYYRLSETDKNGQSQTFRTVAVENCKGSVAIETGSVFSPDNKSVVVNIMSSSEQSIHITAYDVTGRLIFQADEHAVEGSNTYHLQTNLVQGIYLFEIKTNSGTILKKIFIDNKN